MKKIFLLIVGLAAAIAAEAQDFSTHFHNKTLRIDYHFVGNAEQFDDLTMLCLEYKGAPAAR